MQASKGVEGYPYGNYGFILYKTLFVSRERGVGRVQEL